MNAIMNITFPPTELIMLPNDAGFNSATDERTLGQILRLYQDQCQILY